MKRAVVGVALLTVMVGCSHGTASSPVHAPATAGQTTSPATTETSVAPTTSSPATPTSAADTFAPTPSSASIAAITSLPSTVPSTTMQSSVVAHAFPVNPPEAVGYQNDHHDYPAADLFLRCGAPVVAPVDGVVNELRRFDPWDSAVDDPDTRGGIFVSIIGDDGVRYYLAHLSSIVDGLDVGSRLAAGDPLGQMGITGRAGACHTHFALSPPCPNHEWWVRRGVIWPYQYLRQWEKGNNVSPAAEVQQWSEEHPAACTNPP